MSGDYVERCDSGPFCRHWAEAGDCDEECATCGHRCGSHWDDSCSIEGCECEVWKEPA